MDRYISYEEIEKLYKKRLISKEKDNVARNNHLKNALLYAQGLNVLAPPNKKGVPDVRAPHTASYLADVAHISLNFTPVQVYTFVDFYNYDNLFTIFSPMKYRLIAEATRTLTALIAIPIDQPKNCPDIKNKIPFIIAPITPARMTIAHTFNDNSCVLKLRTKNTSDVNRIANLLIICTLSPEYNGGI